MIKTVLSATLIAAIYGAAEYKLIARQKDTRSGLFNKDTMKATGNENVDNVEANTYSIIGEIGATGDDYRGSDGKFQFMLVYYNKDGSQSVVEWKQTSYINTSPIEGYEAVSDIASGQPGCTSCTCFAGLGFSNSDVTYIDGNGPSGCWWNAVCSFSIYDTNAVPGFNAKTAFGMTLYILKPADAECSTTDICEAVGMIDEVNERIDGLVVEIQGVSAAHSVVGNFLPQSVGGTASVAMPKALDFSLTDFVLAMINAFTIIVGLCICWKGGLFQGPVKTVRYAKVVNGHLSDSGC